MFAAHHLVPENYGLVEVSDDESEDYLAKSKKRSDSSDSTLLTSSSSASSKLPTSAHQNSDMKSAHPMPTTITPCY
ncbi:unnamed protein product [Dibothriocephalus latus]|uniref:Uncharacterized protein n=1 Tax=Dibothriocephalus latus TaxID=60516 RepID=A0A3P7LZV4_DIBLA|nr:unnamed protein product [Dibothriocephalus latus]